MDAGDDGVWSVRGAQRRGRDGRREQSAQSAEDQETPLNAHGLGERTRLAHGVAGSQTEFTAKTRRKALTAENAERAEFFETCFPLCSGVKGSG